jgi:Integrase core domain
MPSGVPSSVSSSPIGMPSMAGTLTVRWPVWASPGRTPPRAPNANAMGERIVRTIRSECLDHQIVFDERHLRAVLAEFADYYNRDQPHRSLGLESPLPSRVQTHGPGGVEAHSRRPAPRLRSSRLNADGVMQSFGRLPGGAGEAVAPRRPFGAFRTGQPTRGHQRCEEPGANETRAARGQKEEAAPRGAAPQCESRQIVVLKTKMSSSGTPEALLFRVSDQTITTTSPLGAAAMLE